MPRTIRFHLDENFHHGVAQGLRRYGIDVSTTAEANLLGASDEEQFAFGIGAQRVIFSQDKDFLKIAGQGTEHSGIVYCRQQGRSVGDIIRGLVLIWEVYEADELRNKIEFI
jgi:predicted nuclease of predicted toxin-antitoxin system